MEKLGYSRIAFEVTRRCNLKCKHCMRGDAQDIDIQENAIDNFLDQTLGIDDLSFTGGEPLLAISKIEYIIDGIIKRNIIIRNIQIITNGTIKDQRFYDVIRKAHDYLKKIHTMVYGNEIEYDKNNIMIAISYDQYHNTENIRKNTLDEFVKNIGDYAFIGYHNAGEYVSKIGRAKQLSCGRKVHEDLPFRVELFGKDRLCCCQEIPTFIDKTDFINVICTLYITANGHLTKDIRNGEFNEIDKDFYRISDLNTVSDILGDIDKYNEGKPLCIMAQNKIRDMENETRHNSEEVYNQYKGKINAINRISEHEEEHLFHAPEEDIEIGKKRTMLLYDVKDNEDLKWKCLIHTYKSDDDVIVGRFYNKDLYGKYPCLSDEEREDIKNNIDVPRLSKKNAKLRTIKKIEEMKKYDCITVEQLRAIYKIVQQDFNGDIKNAEVEIVSLLHNSIDIETDSENEYSFYNIDTFERFYSNMEIDAEKALKNIVKAEEFVRLLALIINFENHHRNYCKNNINRDTYKEKAYEFLGAVDIYLNELDEYRYNEFREYYDISSDDIKKIKDSLYELKNYYISLLKNSFGTSIGLILKGLLQ